MFKFGIGRKTPIKKPRATTSDQVIEKRENVRIPTEIAAHLHSNGQCQATLITDLSIKGAGLDGAIAVYPGDQVEIELDNGRRIKGQVAWWLMGSCGIRFSTPLSLNDVIFSQTRTANA